mmetsp:Transcript_21412/g.49075  ORF Transcript_21412/g.49075 Transcript_21412/m.49075 type:complete len:202 (-) Transcript_21412:55-660(-)
MASSSACCPAMLRTPVLRTSTQRSGNARLLLIGAALVVVVTLWSGEGFLNGRNSVRPGSIYDPYKLGTQHGPKPYKLVSMLRPGDRVQAKYPLKISWGGYGYFREGKGEGVPEHLQDEMVERGELETIIEGGTMGTVVDIVPTIEFMNRPDHIKGMPRPLPLIDWDDPNLPMDVTDEWDVELLGSVFGKQEVVEEIEPAAA